MWAIVGMVLIFIAAVLYCDAAMNMPKWARKACTACGGKVKWKEEHHLSYNAEAVFECKSCGHLEPRGGRGSELTMSYWEEKK